MRRRPAEVRLRYQVPAGWGVCVCVCVCARRVTAEDGLEGHCISMRVHEVRWRSRTWSRKETVFCFSGITSSWAGSLLRASEGRSQHY